MPETITDNELIKEFLNGDQQAFNKLIYKYRQKIYWHARKMTGNHLDADEIVQEVVLVIYEKLKNFKGQSSFYTWIYKITSTRSLNFLKKKKVRRFLSFDDPEMPQLSDSDDIIEDIETRDKIKKLDSMLQQLPEKQREVFIMRNINNMSYEEISEITGKTTGALKANYFHALNKISEKMKHEYNG